MGNIMGMITTRDVKENKVDVSPILSMLQMPGTPVLNKIGINSQPVTATKFEWWDDVLPITETTLTAAYTAAGGSLTVADATGLLVHGIVQVDDSIYRITAVNYETKVLTVAIVSNDANHANGSRVIILANAGLEGQDYQDNDYTQKVKRWNVTQIFHDYIKISGTQKAVEQYVQENVFLDEVKRKLERMRLNLERSLINGVRIEAPNNTTPNLAGGIRYFIGQEGITTSGTFTEANFKAFLKQIRDKGGSISEAWLNPVSLDKFLALNADKVRIVRTDDTVGRLVKSYLSNYGETTLNSSDDIPEDEILVYDSGKVQVKPLKGRKAFFEELAKTGDNTKGEIVGEYTTVFRNPELAGAYTITT